MLLGRQHAVLCCVICYTELGDGLRSTSDVIVRRCATSTINSRYSKQSTVVPFNDAVYEFVVRQASRPTVAHADVGVMTPVTNMSLTLKTNINHMLD